jgi:hypothetical protein
MAIITLQAEVDALPAGSIIACEIVEYEGDYVLIKANCCGYSWHTFSVDEFTEIIIDDDFTPALPVNVLIEGVVIGDDEDYEDDE